LVKLVKGNRKSTKIVEYQLICIDYRWICINYQALVLETFFCLSKRWLFLICDIILDYREALVFYRIFSTLVINFFEFFKFGSKSIEKSIENRYQSTSVTVNFTDNRDYRAVLYSMLHLSTPTIWAPLLRVPSSSIRGATSAHAPTPPPPSVYRGPKGASR